MTDTTTPPTAEHETSNLGDDGPPAGSRHVEADDLTGKQRRIARRLLGGEAPSEIADAMGISVRTVYWHIENVYRATDTHSLGEFFAWAYRHRDCCGFGDLMDGAPC